jgi:hypothetical protein
MISLNRAVKRQSTASGPVPAPPAYLEHDQTLQALPYCGTSQRGSILVGRP